MAHNRTVKESKRGASGKVSPVAGFTWELLLIALAWVIAFGVIPITIFWIKRGNYLSALGWTIFWGYFALTYKLTVLLSDKYRERQRKTFLTAEALLMRDGRPHVLYLRSFRADATTSRLLNLSTEEQELACALVDIGPFIAFGEPGEQTPDPGAARMYVEDEHWREKIEDLISNSRLVVARIGNTESFLWEMATAKRLLKPESLLLLLPDNKDEYEEFRRKVRGIFPHQLPDYEFESGDRSFKSHISCDAILYFQADWVPLLQKLKPTILRQNYWVPGVPIFKVALRPVYDQLGIEWKRPPYKLIQILPSILLLFLMIFVLYVGALQVIKLFELIQKYPQVPR
jgi:hypothetical protein